MLQFLFSNNQLLSYCFESLCWLLLLNLSICILFWMTLFLNFKYEINHINLYLTMKKAIIQFWNMYFLQVKLIEKTKNKFSSKKLYNQSSEVSF